MPTTYTLINKSTAAVEAVNIKPFTRANWVLTSTRGPRNAYAYAEYRAQGTDPEVPLILTRSRFKTIITSKITGAVVKAEGQVDEIEMVIRGTDENGVSEDTAVSISIIVKHQASMLPVPDSVLLDATLSAVAIKWNSVTAGAPEVVTAGKLALGSLALS